MTYSIVARDPNTGELGVAVQTCMFAVGSIVPWARPGIGAVATQAISEIAYGPRCLDALASGTSAVDALEQARAADPGAALRQVGVVDALKHELLAKIGQETRTIVFALVAVVVSVSSGALFR